MNRRLWLPGLLCLFLAPSMAFSWVGDFDCDTSTMEENDSFPELAQKADKVNRQICQQTFTALQTLTPPEQRKRKPEQQLTSVQKELTSKQDQTLKKYIDFVREHAEKISNVVEINNIDIVFDHLEADITRKDIFHREFPDMYVDLEQDEGIITFDFSKDEVYAYFPISNDNECKTEFKKNCEAVLLDFKKAFNNYKTNHKKITAISEARLLDVQGWNNYLYNARSQTMLDMVLTTRLERRHLKQSHLVGPPKRQWSTLHPGLVYEYVEYAPSGNSANVGLSIEWFGVNWWNAESSPIKVPFGVSLASVYSDRPEVRRVGHGLMFHVANRYSIGWSRRGSDNGVYISLDLLNAVTDKQKQFNHYKEMVVK